MMNSKEKLQVFHIISTCEVADIALALHYAKLGISELGLEKHYTSHQRMIGFIEDLSDQINQQLDRDYVFLVKKKGGHKPLAIFPIEETANQYIAGKENMIVEPFKMMAA
ncbi:MAG: hypothetical protein AAF599_04895 [Bacteroidota bacterium]